MTRKGQITVFIILGVVILFSIGFVLLIRSETTKVFVEQMFLPEEIIPIREYVQNCLEDVSREGINQIGARGGFTYIPEEIAKNPKARLDIFPEAGMIIPYWYYRGLEYKPNIDEVQLRLARYVEDNIRGCLDDFRGFDAKFDIEELSQPSVRSTEKDLAEKDVTVHMIYRLKITGKADQEETKMSLFNAKIPVRLKTVFEVAEQIYEAENEQLFLENQLIDLMSLSEDVVPITPDKMFGRCKSLVKKVSDLKNNVQELAVYNLPNTVINGTRTKTLMPFDWYAGLHQSYDFDIKDAEDVSVEFRYEKEWPMDFYVSPNQGRVIRADPMKIYNTIPTCFMQYHFVYDIDFPVMISIIDSETKDHESFVFNFAMPVVINHNEGDKIPNPRHIRFDTVTPSPEEYCEEYEKSELTVKARNKVTFDDIMDVELNYRCAGFDCSIGNITLYRGLKTDVPRCTQGIITAKKEGYLDSEVIVDTSKESAVEIDMVPAEKIKFKIVKTRPKNPGVEFSLQDGEAAVVTITEPEHGHTSTAVYDLIDPGLAEIEILSQWNYNYNVDILLLKDDIVTGGYLSNWTVKWRDFITADEVVFYAYENDEIPNMDEEESSEAQYDILINIGELSKEVPKPEFI